MKLNILKNVSVVYFTKFHKGITEIHKSMSIAISISKIQFNSISIKHRFHKFTQIMRAS